jgi:hypothetical protein
MSLHLFSFLYCFLLSIFFPFSFLDISLLFLPYFFPSQFFSTSFIFVPLSSSFLFCFFSYKMRSRNANRIFCSSNTEPVVTTPRSRTNLGCIILIATQHLQSYYVRSASNNPVMTTETVISPANGPALRK